MSDGSDSGVDGSDRDEDNEFGLVSGTSAGYGNTSLEACRLVWPCLGATIHHQSCCIGRCRAF